MDVTKLYDLEEAIQHLSDGLDAVEVMVMGLEQVQGAHAGGLYAVWRYLDAANREVGQKLEVCLKGA
ncbi:MAG: hypothetical protein HFF44_04375 [Lawsonibacter sp.]|nr:hypothetical protein [Lawsonibacter sp.]